jgi:hypothetical protein
MALLEVFWLGSADGFEYLNSDAPEGKTLEWYAQFESVAGKVYTGAWVPPTVHLRRVDERRRRLKQADFPGLGHDVPVFTANAVARLRPLLDSFGQFLPLRCDGAELYFYNVTCVLDAFDSKRGKFFKIDGRKMYIERHAFIPEKVRDAVIFKIPEYPFGKIYVTRTFIRAVEDHGLVGFEYRPLWKHK